MPEERNFFIFYIIAALGFSFMLVVQIFASIHMTDEEREFASRVWID